MHGIRFVLVTLCVSSALVLSGCTSPDATPDQTSGTEQPTGGDADKIAAALAELSPDDAAPSYIVTAHAAVTAALA